MFSEALYLQYYIDVKHLMEVDYNSNSKIHI